MAYSRRTFPVFVTTTVFVPCTNYQTTSHEQPVGILVQPPVANLVESKNPLEHQKRMLDLGAYFRLRLVRRFVFLAQWAISAGSTPFSRPISFCLGIRL